MRNPNMLAGFDSRIARIAALGSLAILLSCSACQTAGSQVTPNVVATAASGPNFNGNPRLVVHCPTGFARVTVTSSSSDAVRGSAEMRVTCANSQGQQLKEFPEVNTSRTSASSPNANLSFGCEAPEGVPILEYPRENGSHPAVNDTDPSNAYYESLKINCPKQGEVLTYTIDQP
jgi:hypothetical protein